MVEVKWHYPYLKICSPFLLSTTASFAIDQINSILIFDR